MYICIYGDGRRRRRTDTHDCDGRRRRRLMDGQRTRKGEDAKLFYVHIYIYSWYVAWRKLRRPGGGIIFWWPEGAFPLGNAELFTSTSSWTQNNTALSYWCRPHQILACATIMAATSCERGGTDESSWSLVMTYRDALASVIKINCKKRPRNAAVPWFMSCFKRIPLILLWIN